MDAKSLLSFGRTNLLEKKLYQGFLYIFRIIKPRQHFLGMNVPLKMDLISVWTVSGAQSQHLGAASSLPPGPGPYLNHRSL